MAIVYRCDRCGREIGKEENLYEVSVSPVIQGTMSSLATQLCIPKNWPQVCPKCKKELFEFLEHSPHKG